MANVATPDLLAPSEPESVGRGRAARKRAPRADQARWEPSAERADPVDILEDQSKDRLAELVPVRWGRMSVSPYSFLRGSAAVMANDLACLPHSGLTVQLCGDAHLANFGVYASPERALLFGINDFDETLPGPFEWDVKRLAVSVAVLARDRRFTALERRAATLAVGTTYRRWMVQFAAMRELDLWYYRIVVDEAVRAAKRGRLRSTVRQVSEQAHTHDHLRALHKLTELVEGRRVISIRPPLVVRPGADDIKQVHHTLSDYMASIPQERRLLLERYRLIDVAKKVVGVGSVGKRC